MGLHQISIKPIRPSLFNARMQPRTRGKQPPAAPTAKKVGLRMRLTWFITCS